jgi:hypothetical protein
VTACLRKVKASSSFLKKRTKKLLKPGLRVAATRTPIDKSFCFFFQKEVLPIICLSF